MIKQVFAGLGIIISLSWIYQALVDKSMIVVALSGLIFLFCIGQFFNKNYIPGPNASDE